VATLKLGGEEFAAAVSPGAMFDLAGAADLAGLEALAFYHKFVVGLVDESDHERLDRVLHDRSLTFADLTEAVGNVVSEAGGRPTERPSPSPGGGSRTDGEPRRVSLSPGTGKADKRSSRAGR